MDAGGSAVKIQKSRGCRLLDGEKYVMEFVFMLLAKSLTIFFFTEAWE